MDSFEPDFAMLDLFRTDVANNTKVLKENLQILKNDPSATTEKLEAMMQGIHAIWGGARVVELETAAKIAQTMKDYFSVVQKGNIIIIPAHIDILLQATDMFAQLSETASDKVAAWFLEYQEEIDSLVAAIIGIMEAKKILQKIQSH